MISIYSKKMKLPFKSIQRGICLIKSSCLWFQFQACHIFLHISRFQKIHSECIEYQSKSWTRLNGKACPTLYILDILFDSSLTLRWNVAFLKMNLYFSTKLLWNSLNTWSQLSPQRQKIWSLVLLNFLPWSKSTKLILISAASKFRHIATRFPLLNGALFPLQLRRLGFGYCEV